MKRRWLIGYDIADPRRLARVHRLMCEQATPLQCSVFVFSGSVDEKERCMAKLAALIDPKADDVRCYALPERGLAVSLGRPVFSEGIYWADTEIQNPE